MRLLKKKRIFTIIVIPHSEDSVFSFRFSLLFVQVLCLIVLGGIVFSLIVFNNYQAAGKKVAEMQEIESENQALKANMDLLAQETEELKAQLAQMSTLSNEIKVLAGTASFEEKSADDNLLLQNQNEVTRTIAGRGGGNTVLDRVHFNISLLQQSIPEKTEQLSQLKDELEEYHKKQACTPSIWPTRGKVSSPFGQRKSPFTGRKEMHYGLDIAAPRGTPVYAAADGKVLEATYRRGTGNVILIDHGYSYKTLYAHLSRFGVTRGDKVQKGQVIGYVGNTGLSTGPHLHYEVRVKGVAVNPVKFLP